MIKSRVWNMAMNASFFSSTSWSQRFTNTR